jgi:DNA repair protein RecN (Recombination protein N)
MLRELGQRLVRIHGQNENQVLLEKGAHRAFLDTYGACDGLREQYGEIYREYRDVVQEMQRLTRDEAEQNRLREMLAYQIADIDEVKPKAGEEEALEAEAERLRNAEKITKQAGIAYRALRGSEKTSGVLLLLDRAAGALRQLEDVVPDTAELAEQIEESRYALEDTAERILQAAGLGAGNPTERLNRIEARLDALNKLKRKYGADLDAVLEFRRRAQEDLDALEGAEDRLNELEKQKKSLRGRLQEAATALRETRREAGGRLRQEVCRVLEFLDMPKVRFDVQIRPAGEFREDGGDEVEFLLSANPGEPLQPMAKIASGGELSRIMLALQSVQSGRSDVDTLIFDEIDTGVSGKTSRKIGLKLEGLASCGQVLCVTHSAQIASLGSAHFFLSKCEKEGRTESSVRMLDEAARVEEIARILGGIRVSDVQKQTARELLAGSDLAEWRERGV